MGDFSADWLLPVAVSAGCRLTLPGFIHLRVFEGAALST